ncbi:MAG: lysophospholipid acyltransferase family protein [Clostridia bacterium]|nr:lysophospholipid acyltransferase family protein [Clostridia bacterium]
MPKTSDAELNTEEIKPIKKNAIYRILTPLGKLIVHSKYKINYIGAENVPSEGGVIFASNHITPLDPVIVAAGCGREMHFMAKKELFEKKLVGGFLSMLNAFPVDRSKFDFKSVNHAINIINGGGALLIFPEGTRSKNFAPQKAKGGVCYIMKKSKCNAIVPVSIYNDGMGKTGSLMTVRYGKPISYDELQFDESSEKMKDLRYAADLIMQKITEQWEKKHEN